MPSHTTRSSRGGSGGRRPVRADAVAAAGSTSASPESSASVSTASRRLAAMLGQDATRTLGDAARESSGWRRQIADLVSELEGANPCDNATSSKLINGEWTLRYTTSSGTLGSIATWETVAGAVADVKQRVELPSETTKPGDSLRITNVVTVAIPPTPLMSSSEPPKSPFFPLPPFPLPELPMPPLPPPPTPRRVAVRITQAFDAVIQSRSRVSVKLRSSNIDVVDSVGGAGGGGGGEDPTTSSSSSSTPSLTMATSSSGTGGILGVPIQAAVAAIGGVLDAAGAGAGGGAGGLERVVASITQPGVDRQPPKLQVVTYLDENFRIVRDTTSFSVYVRVADPRVSI